MGFRLTRKAEEDIYHVYEEGLRLFGFAQAEKYLDQIEAHFELLADRPRIGPERFELKPPVRIYPTGSHILIYQIEDNDDVLIIRIRHQKEDWISDPIGDG